MKIKKLTYGEPIPAGHRYLHLLCEALLVGSLFVACTKESAEPHGGSQGEIPISLTTAISSSAQGGMKAPIVDGGTKEPLTGIHFLRKDSVATPMTYAGISPLVASRDAAGNITFTTSAPVYNKNGEDAWFVAYYPGVGSTPGADRVSWPIDGKTDILVAPAWSAGTYMQPRTTGMTFAHQLAQLEVVCKGTSDGTISISDVRAVWGNITKIEIVNTLPTATFDYATQSTLFENQSDIALLKPDYTTAFAQMPIPDNTNSAVTAAGMFAPQQGSIMLRVTTATMGVVTLQVQLQKDGQNIDFTSGKRHRVTIVFEKTQMLVALYAEIADWTIGYQTDGEIELPSFMPLSSGVIDMLNPKLIKSGSMNGTLANITSTTASYNGYTYNSNNADNNGEYKTDKSLALAEPAYHRLEVALANETATAGTIGWNADGTMANWTTAWDACKAKAPAGAWRLPRTSELALIYLNRTELEKIPGFTAFASARYWSSTEDVSNTSWSVTFTNGNTNSDASKTYTQAVRCVREL